MNPLQDLKDIRTPASIESWPPAYGWWLLTFLLIVGVCLLIIWLLKAQRIRLAKRQALQALQQINASNLDCVSQLNQLLKRVALNYFPNQNVQLMHGLQWTDFLMKTLPNNKVKEVSEAFESMQKILYQPHTSENVEFLRYSKSVKIWIQHALPPNKHTFILLEQNHA